MNYEMGMKGMNTMLVILVFIALLFIVVLFVYFGYDLIKQLFTTGFRGGI